MRKKGRQMRKKRNSSWLVMPHMFYSSKARNKLLGVVTLHHIFLALGENWYHHMQNGKGSAVATEHQKIINQLLAISHFLCSSEEIHVIWLMSKVYRDFLMTQTGCLPWLHINNFERLRGKSAFLWFVQVVCKCDIFFDIWNLWNIWKTTILKKCLPFYFLVMQAEL